MFLQIKLKYLFFHLFSRNRSCIQFTIILEEVYIEKEAVCNLGNMQNIPIIDCIDSS
jgi:hypothetical protein